MLQKKSPERIFQWFSATKFLTDDVPREVRIWSPVAYQTNYQMELEKEASALFPLELPLLPWKLQPAASQAPPSACSHKSACLMYSEAKQTTMLEFGAEKKFIAGLFKETGTTCPKITQIP